MNCLNKTCSNFGNYLSRCRCAKPDKGQKNGSCNRQACQESGATWFNKVMKAYYCQPCALRLNETKLSDGSVLCSPPDSITEFDWELEE